MKKNYFTNADINNIIEVEEIIPQESTKIENSKKGLKIAGISTLAWGVMALVGALH